MKINEIVKLFENDKYILGYFQESAVLWNKDSNESFHLCEHYGNPTCGLIINSFCVIGGIGIDIYNIFDKTIMHVENKNMTYIYGMKIIDDNVIKILTDPWSDTPTIWKYDIVTNDLLKICDFDSYKNKPYQDNIEF
jgi:hypothetical protein